MDYNFKYLSNTYAKLVNNKELNVAFVGGSVTDGTGSTCPKTDGWPRIICDNLAREYSASVKENRQSIGGTGSYFGAFRFMHDIGSSETVPDLFFIEFCINDFYNGETYESVYKNSESLVRKAYSLNPKMDIVYVLTFDELRRHEDYAQLCAHKAVAEKYGLLCINLREKLGPIINFKENYDDGVHPNTKGYIIYAWEIYKSFMEHMPKRSENIPPMPIEEKVLPQADGYYKNLNLVESTLIDLKNSDGWQYEDREFSYVNRKYGGMVSTKKAGARLDIFFKGDEFALLYNAGPNMGKIDISVDGEYVTELDPDLSYNNPKTRRVPIKSYGEHTVTLMFKGENGKEFHLAAYLYD